MLSPEFDLLVAWRAGDREAGRELFERHYERLYKFFDSKIGEDTGKLISDTFMACHAAVDDAEGARAFRLLLLRTARANLYAHLKGRGNSSSSYDPRCQTIEEMGGNPSTLVQDTPEPIERALTRIPLESQLIWELLLTEDLSKPDLAYVIDVTLEEAEARIAEARALLRKKLGPSCNFGLAGFDERSPTTH